MFRELLAKEFKPFGTLTDEQLDHLEQHFESLKAWNVRLNLIRFGSVEEAVQRHYCESLLLGKELVPGRWRIADVGSGAGFPGIPVAVLRPECHVTLIESHQRKAVFLREATRALPNVSVVAARAEAVPERFDWVISRAVTPSDVVGLKLAPRHALLLSLEDVPGGDWEIHKLPWGERRVMAFHVKHSFRSST